MEVFGFMNLHNGSIESRVVLNEHERLLRNTNNLGEQPSISTLTSINDNNQIVSYSLNNQLQRSSNNKFIGEKSLTNPISHIKVPSVG